MAWTELTPVQHERGGGRYASDLTDAEWALIAPFLPSPKKVGRPRTTKLRDVFDAIQYIATTGCQWRMLHNSACGQVFPSRGPRHATRCVIGVPSAVKRLRIAARIWNSATWRSKSRERTRSPRSLKQCILVSTRLRR